MYPPVASGNSWGAYHQPQEGYQEYYDNGYHAMGGYAGEEDGQYEDNQGQGGQYALMQQQAFFTAIAQAQGQPFSQGAQTNATWYPDQYVDPYYEVAAVNGPAVAVTPGVCRAMFLGRATLSLSLDDAPPPCKACYRICSA